MRGATRSASHCHGVNRNLAIVGITGLAAVGLFGQAKPPGPASVQSQSGQFVVWGVRPVGGAAEPSPLATNAQFLLLEPALLVVSCERIKQAVGRELGAPSTWQGRVQVRLHPSEVSNAPIALTAERFRDGWNYRLHLPELIERHRLMRAVVQVVLLEWANRQATGRSAEVPPWLAVGLAEHLLALAEVELLFPPPQRGAGALWVRPVVTERRREDPLAAAHSRLGSQPLRTWRELSWPTEEDFTGVATESYRASAQLLVTELLRLPEGRACLRAFVELLPRYLNWQTAFLEAFRFHFERLLDVEKWWALQCVHFTRRDAAHLWSYDQSWHELRAALRAPVQVRTATDELPLRTQVPLQTILRQWAPARQPPALRERLRQLELLRARLAGELLPLLDEYRRVLGRHLELQERAAATPDRGGQTALKVSARETIRQLDALDARLETLRPGSPPSQAP